MSLRYPIGLSGEVVEFSDGVLTHFENHIQRRCWQCEAGGQLFASLDRNIVHIAVASGPRDKDFRAPFLYVPNKAEERREIAHFYRLGLHYVGDWHTHPQDIAQPSALDLKTAKSTFLRSKHMLGGLLLVIVGRVKAPRGLFVSLTDYEGSHRLDAAW
ncbi:Mov34/MPN/PAD-1 family protein [Caulobacter radicis]